MNKTVQILYLLTMLCGGSCLCQNSPVFSIPQTATIPNYTVEVNTGTGSHSAPSRPVVFEPDLNNQQQQTQSIMQETERDIQQKSIQRQAMQEAQADIEALRPDMNYRLPSGSEKSGTGFYHEAFDKIVMSDTAYSIKENNFLIENAYYSNSLDKQEFDKIIKNSGAFLIAKMKEQSYDLKSNAAKNFILFQFFSEMLQLKNGKDKHLPFKYDFDDYMGVQDYSKMFVTKLLKTGSGQCHSMPLLYLILAEEIGAEAYLALSPNHSYIRFPDDNGKWYNIELTNGMFSTPSYLLQSGYIKSEALQNKIYMENLSRKELLAQQLTDLAGGYIRKYGKDEFVQKIIDKALSLYPNSINAHMIKANLDTEHFEYVMRKLRINPRDREQLQEIRNYPKAVALLDEVNGEYDFIDNLGFEAMPAEAYQQWLQAMKGEKQQRDNESIKQQFKRLKQGSKTIRN